MRIVKKYFISGNYRYTWLLLGLPAPGTCPSIPRHSRQGTRSGGARRLRGQQGCAAPVVVPPPAPASTPASARHGCSLIWRRLMPLPQGSTRSPFPRDLLPGAFTAPGFPRGTGADKQTPGHKTQSKLVHLLGGPLSGVLMRSSLYNERF